VHGWSSVNLSVGGVGGEVVGNGVTITGATVQGGTGGVVSSGNLSLNGTTVNGAAKYGGSFTTSGSTVTGGTTSASTTLPPMRLMPKFTDNQVDMQNILGVGSPSPTCPGSGTGSFYEIPLGVCAYSPPTINGTVVLVSHGGLLTINVPQTTTGAQLYVISANGIGDAVLINGSNSTVPVFAFTDGLLTVNGGISGQLLGASITTTGPTTLTFAPPPVPAPGFAFDSSQTAPTGLGYAASIDFQYQCPGTTAC
jgi:hypothetical protein